RQGRQIVRDEHVGPETIERARKEIAVKLLLIEQAAPANLPQLSHAALADRQRVTQQAIDASHDPLPRGWRAAHVDAVWASRMLGSFEARIRGDNRHLPARTAEAFSLQKNAPIDLAVDRQHRRMRSPARLVYRSDLRHLFPSHEKEPAANIQRRIISCSRKASQGGQ